MHHDVGHIDIKMVTAVKQINVASQRIPYLCVWQEYHLLTWEDLKWVNSSVHVGSLTCACYVFAPLYLSLTLLSHSSMTRRLRSLRDFCPLLIWLLYRFVTPLKLDKPNIARS